MKPLFLVSLAISAATYLASFASAADVAYCTIGAPTSYLQKFSAGDRKSGTGCFIDGETLQFDGRTSPPTTGGAATIELTYSNVREGGMIWIVGPESESVAETLVPYIVTLNTVMFSSDSMLVIQGSFGKGTEISILACSFTVNKPQTAFASAGAFGILIFESIGVQRFWDNSRLRLNGNTFTMTSEPSNFTAYGIGATSQLKLGAGASIEITRNTVRLQNTEGGSNAAFGMAFTGTIVPQGDGAKFLLMSNTINTNYATPLYLPEIQSPTFTFAYNVSQNTVVANPAYAPAGSSVSVLLRPITLGKESNFDFTKNSITANASDAIVMTTSMTLNDNAAGLYKENVLFSTGGSPSFGIQNALAIPSTGELIMEFNDLRRNDTGAPTLPPFYFGGSIQLQGIAMLSVSHNVYNALNADQKQFFLGKSGNDAVSKGSNANFYLCGNNHYNEVIDSQTMRLIYVSDNLRSYLNDVSTCVARATTEPPTTTTTPTTTTSTTTTTRQTPVTGGTRATLPNQNTVTSTFATTEDSVGATTTNAPTMEDPWEENGVLAKNSLLATLVLMGYAIFAGF